MADEVKNGLSADPSRIASQWNRSTVADGSWLQKYTLSPLTARDYYLASAIDALGSATDDTTSALSAAISSVSSIHDEYINYISATISGDISGYIEYISGSVTALSGDLKTSADELLRLIDEEHGRADDAETKINNRLDNMEAATDVIDVYGSWDDFTTNSGDLFTLSGITDNDIIKILNDKNSYPNEMFPDAQSVASGHQTYFRWINSAIPASAHIKPLDPTSGYWDFIGYVDPYYTTTEIDEYINELSATVADNYLSASTDAVKEGHNITVTKKTGPVIEIATKDNVDFTELSADTAWVDTISADVSAFDFYETTSGKRLSETQQGLFINTTTNPFKAPDGDAFWPVEFEQIFSAWYDTDKLINIRYTDIFDNSRLYTLHNVRQYTDNDVTYYDLNFISNDYKVAYTAYAKIKRNGGEGGGAPTAPVMYACDEGPIDVEYYGENGVYVSGDHKVGLSSTYETALKEGSAASAYITSHSGDFLNSAHSAYNKLTFKYGTSTKDYQANSSAYSFIFSAGSGIDFITGTNQITISSNDTTYQGSTYISTANNIISVTGELINSAQSGNLAWKALTGAKWKADTTNMGDISAGFTLSAGTGVGFYKNYNNHILTISAEGKTYADGNYIQISGNNNSINVTTPLVNSASSGYSAYNWITTKSATLQAGQGITFYSAGPNILGISAEGTTYQASSYISTANKKISVTGTLITSAEAGSAASAWVNTNNTKLAYTANFNGTSNVITGYGTSSFAGGISSISAGNTVFTGRNVDFSAGSNIYFTTGTNKLTINLDDNISLGPTNSQIELITESESEEACIVIRQDNQSQLQLYNNYISRNNTHTTWDKVISASNGNFVSAYNQPITIATATTLPAPASMVNGVYYIV